SVGESGGPSGYKESASGGCSGKLAVGATATCTITNDDVAASPSSRIRTLLGEVQGSDAKQGLKASLSNFLKNALDGLAGGNTRRACLNLELFVGRLKVEKVELGLLRHFHPGRARRRAGGVSSAEIAAWIAEARSIASQIGC